MSKIISLVILQAIFCFTLSYSDNTLIETTCQRTPFPDLCISTLKSDPHSSTANLSGLALIVAHSVNGTAIATLNEISTLLKSATDPSLKKALSGCVDSYNTILQSKIPVATYAIKISIPKFAVDAAIDAANEAQKCEDGFGGKLPNSPISGDNKQVHDLSLVLKSIASILLWG